MSTAIFDEERRRNEDEDDEEEEEYKHRRKAPRYTGTEYKYQTEDSFGEGVEEPDVVYEPEETDLSPEEISHLKELEETVSPVVSEKSEEETLAEELAELEAKALEREKRVSQKQKVRDMKKRIRSARFKEKTAPLQPLASTVGGVRKGLSMLSGDSDREVSLNLGGGLSSSLRSGGGVSSSVKKEGGVSLGFGGSVVSFEKRSDVFFGEKKPERVQNRKKGKAYLVHEPHRRVKRKPVPSHETRTVGLSLKGSSGSPVGFSDKKHSVGLGLNGSPIGFGMGSGSKFDMSLGRGSGIILGGGSKFDMSLGGSRPVSRKRKRKKKKNRR